MRREARARAGERRAGHTRARAPQGRPASWIGTGGGWGDLITTFVWSGGGRQFAELGRRSWRALPATRGARRGPRRGPTRALSWSPGDPGLQVLDARSRSVTLGVSRCGPRTAESRRHQSVQWMSRPSRRAGASSFKQAPVTGCDGAHDGRPPPAAGPPRALTGVAGEAGKPRPAAHPPRPQSRPPPSRWGLYEAEVVWGLLSCGLFVVCVVVWVVCE